MHGCTVIARNYLAHARVLAESFGAHNPTARFSMLIVDDPSGAVVSEEAFEVLRPADVGIEDDELQRRATMYGAQGLVASLKPHLLQTLLSGDGDPVVFLDADGCVYNDLAPVAELAQRHSLVLSPHTLDEHRLPLDSPDGPEQVILRWGVMNAGFLAIGGGSDSFLDWWGERTARRCVFDEPRGLMLSQTWLTLAVALFEHHVLRDRGCNVGGWNLQYRDVEWEGEAPSIEGHPLRHFHFSKFDPEQSDLLATYAPRASWIPALDERPGTARLCREYARRLIACGYRRAMSLAPLYDAAEGGAPIEPWMRAVYRASLIEAERSGDAEPPNPFRDGTERFMESVHRRAAEGVAARPTNADLDTEACAADQVMPAHEVAWALSHVRELLARIEELEGIRDEAIGWAEREAKGRELAEGEIIARDALIRDLGGQRDRLTADAERRRAVVEDMVGSWSWRLTRPLREAKAQPVPHQKGD